MKSFKNYITEEKKKYTEEEMESWCSKNIKDFNNGEYVDIYEDEQRIENPNGVLHIKSDETSLPPFKFDCDMYEFSCPNLKTLKIDQFVIKLDNKINFIFDETNNLDYNSINFLDNTILIFKKCNTISPKLFNVDPIFEVIFDCPNNKMVTDFDNYDNCKIKTLYVFPYQKLKNTSNIFTVGNEIKDILFEYMSGAVYTVPAYNRGEILQLNTIFMKYVKDTPHNKHEHVMDFTLAMHEAGFEDEL